ncbi:MAG: hypothetical protein WC840_00730 [Candidatus Peribacteraceae bacterium]
MTDLVPPSPQSYRDDDLVYVDPETRTVIGRVEWTKNDRPKALPYRQPAGATEGKKGAGRRPFVRKYFPWGTYRSMRRVYKLEGKVKEPESNRNLEEVLPKALNETFWAWEEKKL